MDNWDEVRTAYQVARIGTVSGAAEVLGVHHATVQSPALGRRADVSFYLPQGLEKQPLPLVLLLHGVYGSHWAWMFKGGAHETAARLAAETGQPFMLAMPSDGPRWVLGRGLVGA